VAYYDDEPNQQLRNSRIREDGWLQLGNASQPHNNFLLNAQIVWNVGSRSGSALQILCSILERIFQVIKSLSVCEVSPSIFNGVHLGGCGLS
jgi:hypothetical protein